MKISFVNHASLIVETGDVVLLCDPWLDGTVFNNGWALVSPSVLKPEQIARLTHIWFSHEHPDHFSPSTLKSIPEKHRKNITVLFQETEDKRVIQFCAKLGFRAVTELEPDHWINLSTSTKVLCNPQRDEWQADSWLCLQADNECFLNVNDCGINTSEAAHRIAAKTGPVDVLCTQFSYAAWQGNAEAIDEHKAQALKALQHIQTQAAALQAKFVMPFASFVWFCHHENYSLNTGMNRIDTAADWIETETDAEPLVLYPGDTWHLGEPHDWHSAAARHVHDLESLHADPVLQTSVSVDAETLIKNSHQFAERCYKSSSKFLVRSYMAMESYRARRICGLRGQFADLVSLACLNIEPARLYITDLQTSFSFNLPDGLQPIAADQQVCDIALSSESLQQCFKIDWGGETLLINGRFQEPQSPIKARLARGYQTDRWFKFTDLSRRLNLGFTLNWTVARTAIAWRLREITGMKSAG
jgi:UDP-MurNAc hydroxylase